MATHQHAQMNAKDTYKLIADTVGNAEEKRQTIGKQD